MERVAHVDEQFVELGIQHGFLARVVTEERARRHVRPVGDLVHGGVVETLLAEQLPRGVLDRQPSGVLLAVAQRRPAGDVGERCGHGHRVPIRHIAPGSEVE